MPVGVPSTPPPTLLHERNAYATCLQPQIKADVAANKVCMLLATIFAHNCDISRRRHQLSSQRLAAHICCKSCY